MRSVITGLEIEIKAKSEWLFPCLLVCPPPGTPFFPPTLGWTVILQDGEIGDLKQQQRQPPPEKKSTSLASQERKEELGFRTG